MTLCVFTKKWQLCRGGFVNNVRFCYRVLKETFGKSVIFFLLALLQNPKIRHR